MNFIKKIIRKIKRIFKNGKKEIKKYNTYEDAIKDCPTQKAYENI